MRSQSFIGIDAETENDLVLVQRAEGRILFSKRFKNNSADIRSLVGFIRSQCVRPRICLKSTAGAAMKLLTPISGIPDVEVVLLSDAGLRMQSTWHGPNDTTEAGPFRKTQAELFARCAETMI